MSANNSEAVIDCLTNGDFSLQGQIMWGSNHNLLTIVRCGELTFNAIYKPIKGERPLRDFPEESLAGREVAAYLVSEAFDLNMVPPTVYRQDGPMGPGSLQLFIEHDPQYHYFNFSQEDRQHLRPIVLFDAVINNTDRKGGHILVDKENNFWLIDHGICFHEEPKLRTVIWDFAGQPIDEVTCQALMEFQNLIEPSSTLESNLSDFLSAGELDALRNRTDELITTGIFPRPGSRERSYPWPPI